MESSPRIAERGGSALPNLGITVRDFVLETPAAARVFETLGIDYCCGSGQTLAEACKAANRSAQEVSAALEKLDPALPERNWRDAPLTELSQHIVDKHHAFTQAEITRLAGLISKVVAAHAGNHPELAQVQTIFTVLSEELRSHMEREEQLLFPYIAEMEEAARVKRRPPVLMFGTVQNPEAAMIMEHEAAGHAFEKMREITKGYIVPPDGCASYRALYQALSALESDMHQHIHLENNILFPRSVELESNIG